MWNVQPLRLEKLIFSSSSFRVYRMCSQVFSLFLHPLTNLHTHTQPWPINIWTIKDPTLKGVGHRRACGLTHGAGGNLDRQGYINYWGLSPPPSSNLEHRQRQFWSRWWKLLVSSVPAPNPWNNILTLKEIKTHSNQLADWYEGKPVVLEKTNCAWIRGYVCEDEKAFLLIKGGESLRLSCKLRDILSKEVAI